MIRRIILIVLLIALLYLTYELLYLTYEIGYNMGYNLGSETRKYNLGVQAFRNFESEEELKSWLVQDDVNKLKWMKEVHECDKFAELLVVHAFEDGYIMYSTAGSIIKFGELATYGCFKMPANISEVELKMHAWNYCYVGSSIYWIEPQTDQIFNSERKEL